MLTKRLHLAALAGLAHWHGVLAAPSGTATAPFTVQTGVPTLTFSTSVPSPSASLGATLPSQVALPPSQWWCIGQIFCAGSLLQTVNVAQLYPDPKTFVDKPTKKSSQQVLSDFGAFNVSTVTEGDLVNFVDNDFSGEGLELEGIALQGFNANPPFLNNVSDPLLRSFAQIVNSYWTQLARSTNYSSTCDDYPGGQCEGSFIPLNHSFVIPGGRFREQYYWDSYWIIQGLIQSQLYESINGTLQNFMDEIETFGFIPNGGRIYYLNRSQPPLFIHMLYDYVTATNDSSILERALPLAEVELTWWQNNRTSEVTSPFTGQTYAMARYAVTNTAPRPESYLTDYLTANDPTLTTPLTEEQRADLYGELASGAETGWDYTARFESIPALGNPGLRSLNVSNNIPVCLNSILYKAHILLADLYGSSNASAAATHLQVAAGIRAGILDLFWNSTKLAFYDFNLTSNARNDIFTAATFYPLWNGIIPDEVLSSQENAFGFFASLNMVFNRYNGTFPTTFIDYTGLQWDAPNTWPPHQYIALQALRALPSNLTSNPLPTPPSNESAYSLVPVGQLALTEAQLPGQPLRGPQANQNVTQTGPGADLNALNGTVVNGGNATAGEGWNHVLQRELANRFFTSALCSWHATGGSIPGYLPQLSPAELNVTNSIGNTGNMFEKFSNLNVDSSGFGGEYTVQAGFGWTNGAVLWVAATYGDLLVAPECPPLLYTSTNAATGLRSSSAAVLLAVVVSLLFHSLLS
ncbi:glycoside hydrolase family 37 protein [Serpula lacrymans var. lacrymans S7.3]|uniref:Trehalase n=2 Tax=Serpula lacrymans var. lacrymans TaxID=341189 RepID=F8Q0S5_SERL3|nr:glycoside hydrolase family 37 protein [Serpula lacrymans var. lacrymans S7.9]EGN97904.1 glycoside hydrolase family 37 protein [Serpula lacrymans var. lacrymans S7.3]EGO23487.1 glycoside hydrolase family 37 protein [Serpula lacrymans var. lacrymans S7.9]